MGCVVRRESAQGFVLPWELPSMWKDVRRLRGYKYKMRVVGASLPL